MLGAFLALASAVFFGLNNATARRGVLTATVLQGMAVTVILGVPVFFLFVPFLGGFDPLLQLFGNAHALFWLSLAGIIHFVIGRYGNYRATQALGGTLSTPIQQLSVLVALVLALIWLDETLTGMMVLGLILVLSGPALLMGRRKKATEAASKTKFTPDYGPGILWGLVSAFGYGISPLFVSIGLQGMRSMGTALAGVIVSYIAASIVVIVLVIVAGGHSYLRTMGRGAAGWFIASTVAVALSQMLRYMALAVAPVSVVTPIQRLSVVFRLIFGAVLNRDSEVLDASVIFGIVLSMFGAVLLAGEVDPALIAPYLPHALVNALFWEWKP